MQRITVPESQREQKNNQEDNYIAPHTKVTNNCVVCGLWIASEKEEACNRCLDKYGPTLIKASHDPFDYLAAISIDGKRIDIQFLEAKLYGNWVHLIDVRVYPDGLYYPPLENEHFFGNRLKRGIDIHISNIVWVFDQGH